MIEQITGQQFKDAVSSQPELKQWHRSPDGLVYRRIKPKTGETIYIRGTFDEMEELNDYRQTYQVSSADAIKILSRIKKLENLTVQSHPTTSFSFFTVNILFSNDLTTLQWDILNTFFT